MKRTQRPMSGNVTIGLPRRTATSGPEFKKTNVIRPEHITLATKPGAPRSRHHGHADVHLLLACCCRGVERSGVLRLLCRRNCGTGGRQERAVVHPRRNAVLLRGQHGLCGELLHVYARGCLPRGETSLGRPFPKATCLCTHLRFPPPP